MKQPAQVITGNRKLHKTKEWNVKPESVLHILCHMLKEGDSAQILLPNNRMAKVTKLERRWPYKSDIYGIKTESLEWEITNGARLEKAILGGTCECSLD